MEVTRENFAFAFIASNQLNRLQQNWLQGTYIYVIHVHQIMSDKVAIM